jgi:mono/diheme cytochrome c family protein
MPRALLTLASGLVAIAGLALTAAALAEDASPRADTRARQDYLLHCMGCHTENGAGLPGKVPSMRGTLATLARAPAGRSYVLRVPGVTQSTLEPDRLADVLNWAIREFSDAAVSTQVPRFTAAEVAEARSRPLLEVGATRDAVLRGTN